MDMDNVTMEQELMLSLELVKSSRTKHEQKKDTKINHKYCGKGPYANPLTDSDLDSHLLILPTSIPFKEQWKIKKKKSKQKTFPECEGFVSRIWFPSSYADTINAMWVLYEFLPSEVSENSRRTLRSFRLKGQPVTGTPSAHSRAQER